MQRAQSIIRAADVEGRVISDTVTLDREARYRRRVSMKSDGGRDFLLDLVEATYLEHGDALELTDGSLVGIAAAAEHLVEIHASSPMTLAKIAWHIGNRHTPAQITPTAIYIKPDHVLEAMVGGLGGHVHHVRRPWEPEAGAYGSKGPIVEGHSHGVQENRRGHRGEGHHHDHHRHSGHGDDHDHGH